jgi:hypothetical protein
MVSYDAPHFTEEERHQQPPRQLPSKWTVEQATDKQRIWTEDLFQCCNILSILPPSQNEGGGGVWLKIIQGEIPGKLSPLDWLTQ